MKKHLHTLRNAEQQQAGWHKTCRNVRVGWQKPRTGQALGNQGQPGPAHLPDREATAMDHRYTRGSLKSLLSLRTLSSTWSSWRFWGGACLPSRSLCGNLLLGKIQGGHISRGKDRDLVSWKRTKPVDRAGSRGNRELREGEVPTSCLPEWKGYIGCCSWAPSPRPAHFTSASMASTETCVTCYPFALTPLFIPNGPTVSSTIDVHSHVLTSSASQLGPFYFIVLKTILKNHTVFPEHRSFKRFWGMREAGGQRGECSWRDRAQGCKPGQHHSNQKIAPRST